VRSVSVSGVRLEVSLVQASRRACPVNEKLGAPAPRPAEGQRVRTAPQRTTETRYRVMGRSSFRGWWGPRRGPLVCRAVYQPRRNRRRIDRGQFPCHIPGIDVREIPQQQFSIASIVPFRACWECCL